MIDETPEPFALARHAIGRTRQGEPVTVSPLDPELAPFLGAAFAAMPPWSVYPYRPATLARYFSGSRPQAPLLAIEVDERIMGVAGLRLDWLRGPYVQFLGILRDAQGRGLGALAMTWIEREARGAGARNVWVAASDFNTGALRFYERHGFIRVADLPGLVRDERTEVLLRKRLAG